MSVKIEVEGMQSRPVNRRGLMMIDLTCDMTTEQMFFAIQSMRESIACAKWGAWMEIWEEEIEAENASFPANPDEEHRQLQDRREAARQENMIADVELAA